MAPKRSMRRQSSGARSAGGGGGAKIQLRDGKQLSLPSWMSFHHLPEYGISFASQRASANNAASAASESAEGAETSVGDSGRAARQARRGKRTRDERSAATLSAPSSDGTSKQPSKTSNLTVYAAPQVAASNYKEKKEAALDSLHLPTTREIEGHIRYLSEEAMRLVVRGVDDCVRHSLRYSATKSKRKGGEKATGNVSGNKSRQPELRTLAAEIRDYFAMFQPDPEDDDEESFATATSHQPLDEGIQSAEEETGSVQLEDALNDLTPTKYDPTLLPIATIKCCPNMLDRVAMTNGLLTDLANPLQSAEIKKGPCVCRINSASDLVKQGHLLTEILSQCISHDPNGEEFALELQRQRKRQRSHHHGGVNRGVLIRSVWDWSRSLVEWAGFTEGFDSIVVILEDPETIPSPTLDAFFATLSSLRSDHGVPIGIVVVDATPGGLGDRLSTLRHPALRGTAGTMVRELHVPLPQAQLEMFVDRLYSGKCIPTFLWTNGHLLRHIHELFQECDNSIVSVARQLKSDLRRHFAVPGAFVSLLNCGEFVVPNEPRIKWLFGEELCRTSLGSSTAEGKEDSSRIAALFWKTQLSYLCHQICRRINVIFDVSPLLGKIAPTVDANFRWSSRMRQLLELLGIVREKVTTWKGATASSAGQSASLCDKVNEYIILVGRFAVDEEGDTTMAHALVESILSWAGEQFMFRMRVEDAPTVQPRRDVAKALAHPLPEDLAGCSLAHATRIAFQVFQSRVLTLADWHEKYFDAVAELDGNDAGVSSHEAAFFFAVYELVHLGFVRKVATARRKEEAYEKISMVWCSGR